LTLTPEERDAYLARLAKQQNAKLVGQIVVWAVVIWSLWWFSPIYLHQAEVMRDAGHWMPVW